MSCGFGNIRQVFAIVLKIILLILVLFTTTGLRLKRVARNLLAFCAKVSVGRMEWTSAFEVKIITDATDFFFRDIKIRFS